MSIYGARYGRIYQGQFDARPRENSVYSFTIWKRNYTGSISNVVCAGKPIVPRWLNDDPKAPISGSDLTLTLISSPGIKLANFYSTDDDAFKIDVYWNGDLKWTGFLVQDDCNEIITDKTHEINLSFTDNLGLLKDIPFNQANKIIGNGTRTMTVTYYAASLGTSDGIYIMSNTTGALVGDTIILEDQGVEGIYTITDVDVSGTTTLVTIKELFLNRDLPTTPSIGLIVIITPADLTTRQTFARWLEVCMLTTGLSLHTYVYGNIIPIGEGDGRMFDDVQICGETWLESNNWKSTYDVLFSIMKTFGFTCFQSNGVWNMVRWDQLRYDDNDIPAYGYDSNFEFDAGIVPGEIPVFEFELEDYEVDVFGSILRPLAYVREQFNFRQPDLLKNANLQNTGALLAEGTVGPNTYKDFFFENWQNSFGATEADRRIRVVYDSLLNEIERFAVVVGPTSDGPRSVQSEPIEVNEGDKLKLSFEFKTAVSQPGSVIVNFAVRLYNGTLNRYVQTDLTWGTGVGYAYTINPGDDTNQWHTVEIEPIPIPFDGVIYIYLAEATASDADETFYRNLTFEYTPMVNLSTKIIGQVHNSSQYKNVKNNSNYELLFDDAPRNSINGTMFLSTFANQIQDRTQLWQREGFPFEQYKVGQIVTFEEEYHRRIPRMKVEGGVVTLVQTIASVDTHISKLAVIRVTELNTGVFGAYVKNFVFGNLSLEYRENGFKSTAYEMWQETVDDETGLDQLNYEFKYLYSQ